MLSQSTTTPNATVPQAVSWQCTLGGWYDQTIQRIAQGPTYSTDPVRNAVRGFLAAFVGVSIVSVGIGLITAHLRVENISLLYLLAVIIIAVSYGRGPSIAASIMAFLAYDWFFIPPVHYFTVNDSAEWVSLGALLVTGLVVGQLTAEVRRRERVAAASEQRTATLYALAQAIAADAEPERLLPTLTQHTIAIFGPLGVLACALFLPGSDGHLRPKATAHLPNQPAVLLQLDSPEHLARAEAAWQDSAITALVHPGSLSMTYFVPLSSNCQVVGVLSLSGPAALNQLFALIKPCADAPPAPSSAHADPQAGLFAAVCDQMAVALERATLQQEAIAAEALRESDRLKTTLLNSVTHDLQTPIAAVQAAASTLQQFDVQWNEAERQDILLTITTSADRLERLVDNLLALSRIEAGVNLLHESWYPINDIVSSVLDQLDQAGKVGDRQITVDIAEDPLEAPMDHAQIERVMLNLIDNALKYSPPTSPIRIQARRIGSPEMLEVRVSDQGIGIPAPELDAIFGKFYRLQQPLPWTKERPPLGTGLGLAICAGIIHEHGGTIRAESQADHGATFVFTLPMTTPSPPAIEQPRTQVTA